MSTSSRLIVLISGLSVAVYVMWPETGADVTVVPDREQQEGHPGSRLASSGKSVFNRPEEPSSSFIEPTVVTIAEHTVERSVARGQFHVPRGRDAIGRELQKELKRVGCYAGEVHGVWTTSTRRALDAFVERVNARLPTDKPDSILLALVQGYPTKVCGMPCPSRQSLSRTQECIPDALLTRSSGTKLTAGRDQRQAKVTSAWTVKTTAAGGAPVSPAGTELSAAAPPLQQSAPHRVARRHWRPPARHDRGWASNFFSLF